jgi:N-formylglutamate amidohydrolase
MILNIPHASAKIPERGLFIINDETLKRELFYATDWFTDELFVHDASTRLIAEKSRLYIDMERFNDSREIENDKIGRGIIYTKTLDGNRLKSVESYDISEYFEYHKKLESFIDQYTTLYPIAVIVDCHSFQEGIGYSEKNMKAPDICIGFSRYNSVDISLIEAIGKFFVSRGYTIKHNYPFSGSICPDRFTSRSDKVQSIMIEVNRKLYMKNEDFIAVKTENFDRLKDDIRNILNLICDYEAGVISS